MEVTEKPKNEEASPETPPDFNEPQLPESAQNRPLLVDVPIDSDTTALNLMVGFLNVAQRRGAFNFRESGKIGQCIQRFIRQPTPEQVKAAAEAQKAAKAAEAVPAEAAPAEAAAAEAAAAEVAEN